MKVGSLVECIDDAPHQSSKEVDLSRGVTFPIVGEIYTIRNFNNSGGIRLEEILNPTLKYRGELTELAFIISRFREIQPPMDLTELLEETKILELVNQ